MSFRHHPSTPSDINRKPEARERNGQVRAVALQTVGLVGSSPAIGGHTSKRRDEKRREKGKEGMERRQKGMGGACATNKKSFLCPC